MTVKFIQSLILSILLFSASVKSEDFDLTDLAESFAAPDCLDYCVVGICFWLVGCPACHIQTSPKIRHRLPDLVVTAFKKPGQSPWREGRALYGAFASSALRTLMGPWADGSATILEQGEEHANVMFNEVHVIGNPIPFVSNAVGYLCPTLSLPIPYYLSEVDALAWRDPFSEMFRIESITPGMREIWGMGTSVFPRVGYVTQSDPPKAAATNAQRAIDIVLQNFQLPHAYIPFGFVNYNPDLTNLLTNPLATGEEGSSIIGSIGNLSDYSIIGDALDYADMASNIASGDLTGVMDLWEFNSDTFTSVLGDEYGSLVQSGIEGVTQITGTLRVDSLIDGNLSNFLVSQVSWMAPGHEGERAWQMISPTRQYACESFNDAPPDWSDNKQSNDYTWGWQYWRKYTCCIPHAGAYVRSTEFQPICIN